MSELYTKFGELLQLERKRKTLKLEDLSEQLKISVTNLEYIESGAVSELPSMIYFNLFAKAYSEALGIDFDRTIEAIKEDLGESINGDEAPKLAVGKKKSTKKAEKDEAPTPAGENARSIKKLLYLFVAIVAMFIVFLVLYQMLWDTESHTQRPQTTTTETHETTEPEEPQRTESNAVAEYDWTAEEVQKPQKIALKLTPRNESWSTVLADGDTVIFRNLIPGRVYTAEADYRLTVSIGIPSQVRVELNDTEVNLADPETGRVSRVEINQVNLQQFLTPPVDTAAIEPSSTATQTVTPPAPRSETAPQPVDTTDLSSNTEDSSGQN